MTVFLGISPKTESSYLFLCDCLLTSDLPQNHEILLPIRNAMPGESFTSYALMRKAFFPHPRIMLLWAGSLLIAKALAKHLATRLDELLVDSNSFSFKSIVEGCLTSSEADQCSFMLVRVFPNDAQGFALRYHCFCCQRDEDQRFQYFGAGSGFEVATQRLYLGEDAGDEVSAGDLSHPIVQSVRIISNLISNDLLHDTFRYFRTGGWYELFAPTPQGFVPIPYSINVLAGTGDEWDLVKRYSFCYVEGHAIVICADFSVLGEVIAGEDHELDVSGLRFFPIRELWHQGSPVTRSEFTIDQLFGRNSEFAINTFTDLKAGKFYTSYVSGCDVLNFGATGGEISFDLPSIRTILSQLP
ncbi:MAG TPA: hypothetical protein PKY73_10395 [Hyphomonas sp.]|nr:hypothetical protein [Hyphomonas sp.]